MCRTVKRTNTRRRVWWDKYDDPDNKLWIGYTDKSGQRRRAIVENVTNGNVLHLSNGAVISAYSATRRG